MRTPPLRYTFALALLLAAPAFAQTSLTVGPTADVSNTSYELRGGIQITQTAGTSSMGGGVSCAANDTSTTPPTPYTTENSYLRVFDLGQEGLPGAITIQSVDFAIGRARLDSVTVGYVDTTVLLYRMAPGTPYEGGFSRSSLTEVARTTYRVFPIAIPGEVVTAPITAAFQPTDLMVVEWFVPDGTAPNDPDGYTDGFDIRYGWNDEGALGSTYLSTDFNPASTACGPISPTPVQALLPTAADRQWIVVVNASLGVATEAGAPGYTIRLGDARPNPSVSGATIPFTLEATSTARVAVYDVLGREVTVLADREFVAGDHTVSVAPGTLAPGTYVVRLTTPSGVVAQTLTVTR